MGDALVCLGLPTRPPRGFSRMGAGGGERLAWLDGNRSPAFTGQWFGADLLNLLTREDASGVVYFIPVFNGMSLLLALCFILRLPCSDSLPQKDDTKSSMEGAK